MFRGFPSRVNTNTAGSASIYSVHHRIRSANNSSTQLSTLPVKHQLSQYPNELFAQTFISYSTIDLPLNHRPPTQPLTFYPVTSLSTRSSTFHPTISLSTPYYPPQLSESAFDSTSDSPTQDLIFNSVAVNVNALSKPRWSRSCTSPASVYPLYALQALNVFRPLEVPVAN